VKRAGGYPRVDQRDRVVDVTSGWAVPKEYGSDLIKGRCFLDGVEVTNDTYFANETLGIVDRYARDEKGKRYIVDVDGDKEVARQPRAYGHVRIYTRDEIPE
jgi:hypothetical protein